MFALEQVPFVLVRQRKELFELVGIETRNKYEVLWPDHRQVGFIAEHGKSMGDVLLRNLLGHWRSFEFLIFDAHRQKVGAASHPFRWFFPRLDVWNSQGVRIGGLQKTLSLLWKNFNLEDSRGGLVARVSSPPWRFWTFVFNDAHGVEVARIEKQWSGLGQELFTDADTFRVTFTAPGMPNELRNVLVASAVLIDLQYFESKGNRGGLIGAGDFG